MPPFLRPDCACQSPRQIVPIEGFSEAVQKVFWDSTEGAKRTCPAAGQALYTYMMAWGKFPKNANSMMKATKEQKVAGN